MKIGFTAINVKDLDESIDFYQKNLGLSLIRRFSPQEGVEIAFLRKDKGHVIELIKGHDQKTMIIGVFVEDMTKVIDMLGKNGMKKIDGPLIMENGLELLFVEDPDGYTLEYVKGLDL